MQQHVEAPTPVPVQKGVFPHYARQRGLPDHCVWTPPLGRHSDGEPLALHIRAPLIVIPMARSTEPFCNTRAMGFNPQLTSLSMGMLGSTMRGCTNVKGPWGELATAMPSPSATVQFPSLCDTQRRLRTPAGIPACAPSLCTPVMPCSALCATVLSTGALGSPACSPVQAVGLELMFVWLRYQSNTSPPGDTVA